MTGKRKESPQSRLSKSLLMQALLELMAEKPYHQINITELTLKADISRRTFYRHFTTIDDVLNQLFHKAIMEFLQFLDEQKPKNIKMITRAFFQYWELHKEFLIRLMDNDLIYLLVQKYISEMHYGIYHNLPDEEKYFLEYVFIFFDGGIWNVLIKWFESKPEISAEDMSEIVYKVIEKISRLNQ